MIIKISEADLKRTVLEHLHWQQNLGRLWFTRLNSGVAYVRRGGKYYKIQLCEEGTADILILKRRKHSPNDGWKLRCIFIELKSTTGKQSEAQKEFQKLVIKQGASYYLVRDIETLEGILAD